MHAQQRVQLTSTNRPIDLTTFLRCSFCIVQSRGSAEGARERLASGHVSVNRLAATFLKLHPGAHTDLAIPVPIPNTVVKQIGPMVLDSTERVGQRRGFYSEARDRALSGSGRGPHLFHAGPVAPDRLDA